MPSLKRFEAGDDAGLKPGALYKGPLSWPFLPRAQDAQRVFYLCNINIGSETIEELLPLVGANDISGGPRFWRSRVST